MPSRSSSEQDLRHSLHARRAYHRPRRTAQAVTFMVADGLATESARARNFRRVVGTDSLDVARGAARRRRLLGVGVAAASQCKVDARLGGVLQDVVILLRELGHEALHCWSMNAGFSIAVRHPRRAVLVDVLQSRTTRLVVAAIGACAGTPSACSRGCCRTHPHWPTAHSWRWRPAALRGWRRPPFNLGLFRSGGARARALLTHELLVVRALPILDPRSALAGMILR